MIINLKHNFYIEVDERNYTLKRTYTNKNTGKPATRTHGYYVSLEDAIINYIKLATLDVNDRNTVELFEYVEQFKGVCRETIDVIKYDVKE